MPFYNPLKLALFTQSQYHGSHHINYTGLVCVWRCTVYARPCANYTDVSTEAFVTTHEVGSLYFLHLGRMEIQRH